MISVRWGRLCAVAVALAGPLLVVRPVRMEGPPPDARFGAVEAISDHAAAIEAGVGWERLVFHWSELQPNGPDEWNGYHVPDDWLAQAAAAGREVVGLIKHTPVWAAADQSGCGPPRGLELPVDDPENLWATFVRRIVERYEGRVDTWIVWNEPDIAPDGPYTPEWCGSVEEYYRLLHVAYLAAHQVQPDVTIQMAALTYFHDPTYLRRFLDVALQDPSGAENGYYFDVVPVHIYFRSEAIPEVIGQVRATLAAYGLQKPIWVNETNASPDSDPLWPIVRPRWRVDLEEQASFLLQAFALGLSSGAERISVYRWMDAGLPPGGEPFGLIRPDYSRRPAYEAFRLITTYYAGTVAAQAVRQPLYYQVTLNRGTATTRALWARTASDVALSVPSLATEGLLVLQNGEIETVQAIDGVYLIDLEGARCADELGCIIGGPAVLLVEQASGDAGNAWIREGEMPPPSESEPVPPATSSPAPTATAEPTAVPTLEPTPDLSPTPTAIPIQPSPTAEASPAASTSAPPVEPRSTSVGLVQVAIVVGLILLGVALHLVLREARSG